jgi:multiple sugar transport system substrate-binding protein
MKRTPLILIVAAVAALALAAGCGSSGGGGTSASPTTAASHAPVTVTLWHVWTAPSEVKAFKTALAGYKAQYPWITLKVIGFPDSTNFDQQIIKAINAGNGPDVIVSFGPDYVGQYAHDGLLLDLKPYMEKDNVPTSTFAPATYTYTQFESKQVVLPVLTDAYGFYYNKDLLAKAGITAPPKTMDELMADAKKLTVRNSDGSLKVCGFLPLEAWEELDPSDLGRAWGASWFNDQAQPQFSTEPGWAKALTWQKQLVDWYGYANALKFLSTYTGSEFDANNAFETGKVAMVFDGEWRTRMIANDHPELNYGTAPFPADVSAPDQYGSGRVGGTITGIPKTAKHPDDAWDIVKFMATDTTFLVKLANGLGNVPTTTAAASSPDLQVPPQFKTFIDVWNNPKSDYSPPLTPGGSGYAALLLQFDDKWVAGKVPDLQSGLEQLDKQVADQLALGSAP